jgi:hypothetical protein
MLQIDHISIHLLEDSETKERQILLTKDVVVPETRIRVTTDVMFCDPEPEAVADAVKRALTELEWGTTGWDVWTGKHEAQIALAARNRIQLGIERPGDLAFVARYDHENKVT